MADGPSAPKFALRPSDLAFLRRLEAVFRSFLALPGLAPDGIGQLGRAIRFVQRLPFTTPDVAVTVTLTRTQGGVWTLSLSGDRIRCSQRYDWDDDEQDEFEREFSLKGCSRQEGDPNQFLQSVQLRPDELASGDFRLRVSGSGAFPLRKSDVADLQRLETAFRAFLTSPDLRPEEIVGLGRAIRALRALPLALPDIDVTVTLDYQSDDSYASSSIRLSPDLLAGESGSAVRFAAGDYESGEAFEMCIRQDGGLEMEGSRSDFIDSFLVKPGWHASGEYSLFVSDDSDLPGLAESLEEDGG